MDALFPDMPVNSGLEKVLALASDGIAKGAQSLMSLSFLVIPVSLAVGIKLFQWLGPFAAAAALLIPLSGLLAAESILAERAILPLSGQALAPYTTGKAAYNDNGEDEDKASVTKDLLQLTHAGVIPPEHNPPPYIPPEASSKTSKRSMKSNRTASAAAPRHGSVPSAVSEAAAVNQQQTITPAAAPQPVDLDTMSDQEATELNQVLGTVAETLFGSSSVPNMTKRTEALLYLNRIRDEIGLPHVRDDTFPAMLAAAKDSAVIVGCD